MSRFVKILIAVGIILVLCFMIAKEISPIHKEESTTATALEELNEFSEPVNQKSINREQSW